MAETFPEGRLMTQAYNKYQEYGKTYFLLSQGLRQMIQLVWNLVLKLLFLNLLQNYTL